MFLLLLLLTFLNEWKFGKQQSGVKRRASYIDGKNFRQKYMHFLDVVVAAQTYNIGVGRIIDFDHYKRNFTLIKQKTGFGGNNEHNNNNDSCNLSNIQNNYIYRDLVSYYLNLWHYQSSRYYLSFGMNDSGLAQSMPEERVIYDNDLKMGDNCRIPGNDRSKRGKVQYVGQGINGKIGIELDLWTRGAYNGTIDGKHILLVVFGK